MPNKLLIFHVMSVITLDGMIKLYNIASKKGYKCLLFIDNHIEYTGDKNKIILGGNHNSSHQYLSNNLSTYVPDIIIKIYRSIKIILIFMLLMGHFIEER